MITKREFEILVQAMNITRERNISPVPQPIEEWVTAGGMYPPALQQMKPLLVHLTIVCAYYQDHPERLISETQAAGWQDPAVHIYSFRITGEQLTHFLFCETSQSFPDVLREYNRHYFEQVRDLQQFQCLLEFTQESEALAFQIKRDPRTTTPELPFLYEGQMDIMEDPYRYGHHNVLFYHEEIHEPLYCEANREKLQGFIESHAALYALAHPSFMEKHDLVVDSPGV